MDQVFNKAAAAEPTEPLVTSDGREIVTISRNSIWPQRPGLGLTLARLYGAMGKRIEDLMTRASRQLLTDPEGLRRRIVQYATRLRKDSQDEKEMEKIKEKLEKTVVRLVKAAS